MKKIGLSLLFVCALFMLLPLSVQAADTISVNVEVPGKEVVTLEMQKTDYIGTVKYKLQNQMDIDLNKMDLIYNDKILSEVKRFSSGLVPAGSTIKMQPSDRWNYDAVKGVDDSTFSIARPKEENLKKIYAKDYGMRPGAVDNTEAFTNALKDCSVNAYLVIEQGIYYFRGMTDDIAFNNMENVIIDGNGSTFIFDTKYCMKIYGGNGVEFRNLKVNWDWDKIPVGSLVQIDKKHSDTVFDIRFIGVDEVDENIPIGTFWYLDPDDLVVGSYGKYKAYTPGSVKGCLKKVEKVGSNILRITHDGSDMKRFYEGEYYLLRHFEYSGRVFSTSSYAKNITYNNISIYGFTGMGWVFSYKANHFQIIHSYLGLDPEGPKERRISTAADAIHILNTGGYFRISDCDLSFSGDDIINVHDDMMDILEIDESRTTLRGWATSSLVAAGDTLRFRTNQQKEFTHYEAKVVSLKTIDGYEREVVLEEPLPAEITEDCFIYSKSHSSSNYVISDNYIHETRSRASLLNDDYGLFENNYVYRSGGIEVCSAYEPGRWFEGEGACHVVARNNTFEECNFGGLGTVVKINVKVAGEDSTEQILKDIRIEDNVFYNCKYREDKVQNLMEINNVDNLVISGNVIENCGEIKLGDVVGTTKIENNLSHTEHKFVNGVCRVCNLIWEKEIDGITYRVVADVVKRRPIAETVSGGTKGGIALSVVKVDVAEGQDIVLIKEITDDATGQTFVLTSIEKDVFAGNKAASITIPETVTKIGENALGEIKNIIYVGKKPQEDPMISSGEDHKNPGNSSGATNQTVNTQDDVQKVVVPFGKQFADTKTKSKYKVTSKSGENPTVTYLGTTAKKASSVTIPAKVNYNGVSYKVTAIGSKALYKNKTVKKITIGANVTAIGKKAFYGCKSLKTINVKTTKLKDKKVGAQAFVKAGSKHYKKLVVILPKKVTKKVSKKFYKSYRKMLRKKGLSKKAKLR